jgi:hypothetical protein
MIKLNTFHLKTKDNQDIGLSPLNLGDEESRVVLEWLDYFGDVNNLIKDLDLVVSYESNQDEAQFLCEVSYLDRNCGGVNFHGDNSRAKYSKTTEAVTFNAIARYDYLIYVNRFVKKASELAVG